MRQDSSVSSLLFLLHVSGLGGERQDSSVGSLLFLLRVSGLTALSVSLFTFPLSTHAKRASGACQPVEGALSAIQRVGRALAVDPGNRQYR